MSFDLVSHGTYAYACCLDTSLDDIPIEPVLLMDGKMLIGETPVWNADTSTLHWIDIEGQKLFGMDYHTKVITVWKLPKRPGAFTIRHKDFMKVRPDLPYLMAFEDGFALYNPDTGESHYLEGDYKQTGHARLNDGRCDRQGRFVCGGVNLDHIDESMDVWHATQKAFIVNDDLKVKELLPGPFRCYNCTNFSPDGTIMYMTDTPTGKIQKYRYDTETGTPHPEPEVFAVTGGVGFPDGSALDAEGNLWVAEVFGGRVSKFSPEGKKLMSIDMSGKVLRTTCGCIGGPNLDTLFITTASIGMSEEELKDQPWSGGLIGAKLPPGVHGLPETKFRG